MGQHHAMTAWEVEAERRREILAPAPRSSVEDTTPWRHRLTASIRRMSERAGVRAMTAHDATRSTAVDSRHAATDRRARA